MGKFVIYKRGSGYQFYLKAANGETIGISESYIKKEICMKGVESVIYNAEAARIEDQTAREYAALEKPKFEIYRDQNGKYHFRLLTVNGEKILESQAYTAKASCQNGIRSVKVNAPTAEVEVNEIKS